MRLMESSCSMNKLIAMAVLMFFVGNGLAGDMDVSFFDDAIKENEATHTRQIKKQADTTAKFLKKISESASDCFSIRTDDRRHLCLALTKKEKSTCFSIKNDDMRWECVASFDGKSNCFSIKNNDARFACLAQFDGKHGCFSIRGEDTRWDCLAQFDGKSNCFSIRNEEDRLLCLATNK